MTNSIQTISLVNLGLSFLPALFVLIVLKRWSLNYKTSLYAISRMLVQLLLIGYLLAYIFELDSACIVIGVLAVMVIASSWIALRTVLQERRRSLYKKAVFAVLFGSGFTLLLITQLVLQLQPWYLPTHMIPLAGMAFAAAMNSIALAVERLESECANGVAYSSARGIALRASMIPVVNSLFAAGLVSLPGMMTGQILSGVSPLIAVRYQVMIMAMLFGASGLASACFLSLVKADYSAEKV